jgi:serine/threonine-protein kinase
LYSAVDEVLERRVAVKLIREGRRRGRWISPPAFRQEARSAAGFTHPHVVRVYDFGLDRHQRPFLVMELLEGETLRQRLASGAPISAPGSAPHSAWRVFRAQRRAWTGPGAP